GVAVELYGVHIIALAMGLLLLGLWLASLCLPSAEGAPLGAQTAGQPLSFWPLFRRPAVLAFFVAGLLMQLSHGPYYAFYTLHLHALTVPGHWIGALWSVGVVAEILLFMCMAWLLRRFHIKQLLVASLLLAALRWAIIGSATTNWPWLVFAQCLPCQLRRKVFVQPSHSTSMVARILSCAVGRAGTSGLCQRFFRCRLGGWCCAVGHIVGRLGCSNFYHGSSSCLYSCHGIAALAATNGKQFLAERFFASC